MEAMAGTMVTVMATEETGMEADTTKATDMEAMAGTMVTVMATEETGMEADTTKATDMEICQAGKVQLGWCDTALVLPYAAIQIFWPGIADRYGPKRVLAWCLGFAGLSTLATYSAPSLLSFMLGL